jgi:hypothetical protein
VEGILRRITYQMYGRSGTVQNYVSINRKKGVDIKAEVSIIDGVQRGKSKH